MTREDLQGRLAAGQHVGRYEVRALLGEGGMGEVYLVEDAGLGRDVALKLLRRLEAVPQAAERFRREVGIAARLQHANVVPVLEAGETSDGLAFYTMPYVEGESLRAPLARGTRVPLPEALDILRDVARALAYAHEKGVIHRDIKPENVLLSGGAALVTDFGIAKAIDVAATAARSTSGATTQLTAAGTSLGTPAYMAPEQALGEEADGRADLYAWGVMAYELLAGAHPFAGKTSAQQLVAAHLTEAPAPLARQSPHVPTALASLVMQCLAKDRAERPQSARELERALGAISTTGGLRLRRRPRWRLIGIAAVMVVVALLGIAYTLVPPELLAAMRTLASRAPPDLRVNRVVVAPLENETGDASLTSIGPMAADLITEGLASVASLEVVDARTALATNEVVSRLPRPFRSGNPARALAEETGSKVLVSGSFFRDGDSLRFRTKVIDAATGAVLQVLPLVASPMSAPSLTLPVLAQRVAASLRGASDRELTTTLGTLSTPPSMAAYEATREAYLAYLTGDTAQLTLAKRAVALDSTYGFAIALLPWVASTVGEFDVADSALARASRLRSRLSPFERGIVDILGMKGTRANLEASRRTVTAAPRSVEARVLLAIACEMAREPRHALAAIAPLSPDRGILLVAPFYWYITTDAHLLLGDLDRAKAAVREGERRFASDASLRRLDASIAAIQGHEVAAARALDQMRGSSPHRAQGAAEVSTLLRSRGGRDSAGRAFADAWLARIDAAHDASRETALGRLALLSALERWPAVLRLADSLLVRPGRVVGVPEYLPESARAVALVHLGRRVEALAADSALAALGEPFWAQGAVQVARARIAAHMGDLPRAVALADRALDLGYTGLLPAFRSLETDALLLPLRADPSFRALMRPRPEDAD